MCLPRIVKIVTCRPTRDLMKENSEPLPDLSDDEFIQIFHLKRNIVKDIIEELRPLIPNPRRSDGVPLTAKVKNFSIAFVAMIVKIYPLTNHFLVTLYVVSLCDYFF